MNGRYSGSSLGHSLIGNSLAVGTHNLRYNIIHHIILFRDPGAGEVAVGCIAECADSVDLTLELGQRFVKYVFIWSREIPQEGVGQLQETGGEMYTVCISQHVFCTVRS